MFHSMVARGRGGSILWGAGDAAVLSTWAVTRDPQFTFTLCATVERMDAFRLRQIPLLFAAQRRSKPAGLWCFPVQPKSLQITGTTLTATLGPPEGR